MYTVIICCSVYDVITLKLNLAFLSNFLPTFRFFVDFQWNDNINNLCCSPVVLKKIKKTSKKFLFLGPICTKNGSLLATLKMENNFFGRNNKSRSSAFWNFLFYQNIIRFGWVMNLFLSWMMFFVKKVSFPAKKAVDIYVTHHHWLIFDWWDWGRIFIKWDSWEKSLKTLKRQKKKATKSFDIRDMFRRQKHSDSKRLRVEDIDPDMIIMD